MTTDTSISSLHADISVSTTGFVSVVELRRGPNNFFDYELICALADTYERLDNDDACRAIVLASEGKHFCAGADFSARSSWGNDALTDQARQLYKEAVRLFRTQKPVVAAVQGAAIGGGLGLALSADFRVTSDKGRFCANFARLGFHQGFGLSVTLPRVVGEQQAAWLLFSGERIKGDRALNLGLVDKLVGVGEERAGAIEMATDIARSGPLAVKEIRTTLRTGLAEAVESVTARELAIQDELRTTRDFKEGVRAMAAREYPDFTGR